MDDPISSVLACLYSLFQHLLFDWRSTLCQCHTNQK